MNRATRQALHDALILLAIGAIVCACLYERTLYPIQFTPRPALPRSDARSYPLGEHRLGPIGQSAGAAGAPLREPRSAAREPEPQGHIWPHLPQSGSPNRVRSTGRGSPRHAA